VIKKNHRLVLVPECTVIHLKVKDLCDALSRDFDTFSVLHADTHQRQIDEAHAAAMHLWGPVEGLNRSEKFVRSIRDKELATGPGIDVRLEATSGEEIVGTICEAFLQFRTNAAENDLTVRRLAEKLASFVGGPILFLPRLSGGDADVPKV
jgi:hypothetical protein